VGASDRSGASHIAQASRNQSKWLETGIGVGLTTHLVVAVRLNPTKNQPMNLKDKTAIFIGVNSADALTNIFELAKLGAKVAIDSVPHTRLKGACALLRAAFLASTLALEWSSVCLAEETEIMLPALIVSKSEANKAREINKLLKEGSEARQIERIMAREGLKHISPQLPKFGLLSENGALAVLAQIDYTNLALKLGAPVPPRPDISSGTPVLNNRFLHYYNNLILRSIAQHLGLPVPASVVVSKEGHVDENLALARQNTDLLRSIGQKRGSIQP
jgi:hypothetical protein